MLGGKLARLLQAMSWACIKVGVQVRGDLCHGKGLLFPQKHKQVVGKEVGGLISNEAVPQICICLLHPGSFDPVVEGSTEGAEEG